MGNPGAERLSALGPGKRAVVVAVEGGAALRRKVLDLGLVPGTELRVEKVAPLGDPVTVVFRGFELTLRKDEAAAVQVAPVSCTGCGCCGGGCH